MSTSFMPPLPVPSVTVGLTNAVTVGLTVKSATDVSFSRVCRTFVFLGRFFLVSSLFVCFLFIDLFVGLSSDKIKITPTVAVTVTVTVMVIVMIITKN